MLDTVKVMTWQSTRCFLMWGKASICVSSRRAAFLLGASQVHLTDTPGTFTMCQAASESCGRSRDGETPSLPLRSVTRGSLSPCDRNNAQSCQELMGGLLISSQSFCFFAEPHTLPPRPCVTAFCPAFPHKRWSLVSIL